MAGETRFQACGLLRYLLDTNVISEATKHRPNEKVLRWIDDQDEEDLFLSVATLAPRLLRNSLLLQLCAFLNVMSHAEQLDVLN